MMLWLTYEQSIMSSAQKLFVTVSNNKSTSVYTHCINNILACQDNMQKMSVDINLKSKGKWETHVIDHTFLAFPLTLDLHIV